MDVQTASAEVAEYIRSALDYLSGGQDPADALASAEAATGVSADAFASADMGQTLDYLCTADGLSPQYEQYFDAVASSYSSSGSVAAGGASAGASASASASASATASATASASASASTIVYNYPTYIENHYTETTNEFDFNDVNGDISIDLDQSETTVDGDGNVVVEGDGDVNAATGDGASAAQAGDYGTAVSNTGDGAVQNFGIVEGDIVGEGAITIGDNASDVAVVGGDNSGVVAADVENLISGDNNTANQVDGTVTDSALAAGGDATNYNLGDAQVTDSAINFGAGDNQNVSNNTDTAASQGSTGTTIGDIDDAAVVLGDGDAGNVSDVYNHGDNIQQTGIGDNVGEDQVVVEVDLGVTDSAFAPLEEAPAATATAPSEELDAG